MHSTTLLRFSVPVIILISAAFHLSVGLSLTATETSASTIDIVFGVIYVVIDIGLFVGKRLFIYLGLIFPLVDGIGGTAAHINSHSINPLIAAVIDVVIILAVAISYLTRALDRLPESEQF
jgi:hypothetical protein